MKKRFPALALAFYLLAVLVGCGKQKNPPSFPSPDSTTVLVPSASPTATPTPMQASTPTEATTPEPTSEPTPEPKPSAAIDLSDPDAYRRVNMFLSNFSECAMSSFSMDDPDYSILVGRFAYNHAEINSPSLVEDCDEMQDGYPVNRRLSEANILKILRRFFGDSIDPVGVARICENGYYYDIMTNGAPSGYAFTLADTITDLGDDKFEVQFHVYGVPHAEWETYDASSSSSVYSARPDNLPTPLYNAAQKFSCAPGTATFVLAPNQTSAVPYHLLTWNCDYEWDGYY